MKLIFLILTLILSNNLIQAQDSTRICHNNNDPYCEPLYISTNSGLQFGAEISLKFKKQLGTLDALIINVMVSENGLPENITFGQYNRKNQNFESVCRGIKKYIRKNCRWLPAYTTSDGKIKNIPISMLYYIKWKEEWLNPK